MYVMYFQLVIKAKNSLGSSNIPRVGSNAKGRYGRGDFKIVNDQTKVGTTKISVRSTVKSLSTPL